MDDFDKAHNTNPINQDSPQGERIIEIPVSKPIDKSEPRDTVARELFDVPGDGIEDTGEAAQSFGPTKPDGPPESSEVMAEPFAAASPKGAGKKFDFAGLLGEKKRLMLAAGAVVVLAGVGAGVWALMPTSSTDSDQNVAASSDKSNNSRALLGVAITLADGVVEYKRADSDWQPIDNDTQLAEGDQVRTHGYSRTVLTLDDGSVVRLNAESLVSLTSLDATDIEITQEMGTVYSRVVPSDRGFRVVLDGDTYEALGTAFATSRNMSDSGVQVFQGSVKASAAETDIAAGKQLFKPFGDYIGALEVTDIDMDLLLEDDFIKWNLAEDEKDDNFKDKLGILSDLKARSEQLKKDQEEAAKAENEQKDKDAQIVNKQDDKDKFGSDPGARLERGNMTLSASGTALQWAYSGKAPHGYKLVFSNSVTTPVFSQPGTDADHHMGESATLRKGLSKGTYHVRACAYTNGTESTPCVDYSNVVTVTVE